MKLVLKSGASFVGQAFGHPHPVAGEIVFNTGMVGYPETLTDPSYTGQILVFSYPLIGNYGVPESEQQNLNSRLEAFKIHPKAIIVNHLSKHHSHWQAQQSLDHWLKKNQVLGLTGIDTRMLTQMLRVDGSQLAKIVSDTEDINFEDPNQLDLVGEVSPLKPQLFEAGKKRVVLLNTGCKLNIIRCMLDRNVSVLSVPYNYDFSDEDFDGILLSNGPGDPKQLKTSIQIIQKQLSRNKPIFGVCLGHQLLALAAGATSYKLKFGHRSQNQPCIQVGTKRCYITSQNHGYAVDQSNLPEGFKPWFINANDGSNEGIIHTKKPFCSVQFHPEACPGPKDTEHLFDQFCEQL